MLVPLAGSSVQIHDDSPSGSAIQAAVGAMQDTNAAPSGSTIFLHREDKNRARLTDAHTESSPAKANSHWSCPIVMPVSVRIEYTICMEVFVLSHPNRLFAVKIYTMEQAANEIPLIISAAAAFAVPSVRLPYLVQRRIWSAPDW
mgnify:CR=1 FL=1